MLPEAIFHANHTVRYPVSIRAVGDETTPARFQNLSTVEHCTSLGLEQRSSVCRYAVSLGLVVYYPHGQAGTEEHLPSPEAPSADYSHSRLDGPSRASTPLAGERCPYNGTGVGGIDTNHGPFGLPRTEVDDALSCGLSRLNGGHTCARNDTDRSVL